MPRHPPLALRNLEVDEDARARYAILNRRSTKGAYLIRGRPAERRSRCLLQEPNERHSLKAEERTVRNHKPPREVLTPCYLENC